MAVTPAQVRRLEAKARTVAPSAEETELRRDTGFKGILIVFCSQPDVNTGNDGLQVDHAALIRALCDIERGSGCAIAYCDNPEPLNPLIWAPPAPPAETLGRMPHEPQN